jgi:peptidoglycan/LPS O-acetylase OafA/YrhL
MEAEPEQPLTISAAKVFERGKTPPNVEGEKASGPNQTQQKTVAAQKQDLAYWPEVDGLRSVAVLSVLLFHFKRNLLPGGFAGVDVFFVISGFLITRLLLDDIRHQRFSLTRFYQRRVARIAPAFFLVLWATLVGSWLVYSNLDFASTGTSTALSSLSVVNMLYMLKEGYFQASPDARPNLHYWSLSVEEQFYIFFPLLLFAVVAWRGRALTVLATLAAVSFVLCIVITWLSPVYAFFLLPTRVCARGGRSFSRSHRSSSRRRNGPCAGHGW